MWLYQLLEFITYKLRCGTLREQQFYDPGKEGRGHCQSAAGGMRSFKHKRQSKSKGCRKMAVPGGNSEQKEDFEKWLLLPK